jgi:hypothetical protein
MHRRNCIPIALLVCLSPPLRCSIIVEIVIAIGDAVYRVAEGALMSAGAAVISDNIYKKNLMTRFHYF